MEDLSQKELDAIVVNSSDACVVGVAGNVVIRRNTCKKICYDIYNYLCNSACCRVALF